MKQLNPKLLKGLTSSLLEQEDETENDLTLVYWAKQVIKNKNIEDEAHCFLLFAAFNYLNAAVKRDKSIGYYFKSVFKQVVPLLDGNGFDIAFCLNMDETAPVLYVEFEGCFQFSFHNPNIKEIQNQKPLIFDGIRKQPKAGYIFREARLFISAGDLPEV